MGRFSNPRKTNRATGLTTKTGPTGKHPLPAWKLWLFRLTALIALPLVFLAILEAALHLIGFGHRTAFLLPAETAEQPVWIPNPRFGWKYFGRNMAREPQDFSIARQKPPNTIRILVLGESAAYGDPLPAFGLPRMLQTMLNLRFPGTSFEVVNVAMTGINSHTIRDIARDCTAADADIWVVYMGNNEVVGPFGAGTVFSQQTPSLGFIRASLALKSTRTGQLLDAAIERMRPPPAAKSEWGGMVMFLDQAVRADDPRMTRVYNHFQQNLADIITTGESAGAKVVVSTVAVNLKDCAPFASASAMTLTAAEQTRWQEAYRRAMQSQNSGDIKTALAAYDEALQIDDSLAELHFRRATCLLATGRYSEAQKSYSRARDLDTLRFRCDSRLNEIIRATAKNHQTPLADAEQLIAVNSTNGIPGKDLFYEHVHLTWQGNWLLARTLAEQVATQLPASVTNRAQPNWPTADTCARALGWTERGRREALTLIFGRLQDPPFTHQLNHADQLASLAAALNRLAPAASPSGLRTARSAVETAATNSPNDAILLAQLAEMRRQTGDLDGAIAAARRVAELWPHAQSSWSQLGLLLIQAQKNEAAATALNTALTIDPDNVWTLQYLAQLHTRMALEDDALREYRRAVALKPRFGPAYLGIGQILEARGDATEAEKSYQRALQNRIYRTEELTTLGRFCLTKGWFDAAVTNLQDALKLGPDTPALHRDLAEALTKLGRGAEAEPHRAAAAPADPQRVQALFRRGLELGRAGKPVEAAEQFREVVRVMPELPEGHLNLAIALESQGLADEARDHFQTVLLLSPTNSLAAEHLHRLTMPSPLPATTPPSRRTHEPAWH